MNRLKLHKLSAQNLTDRQMDKVKGGDDCVVIGVCLCGCQYANSGGSSISDNCTANRNKGLGTPRGVVTKATADILLCFEPVIR